MREVKLPSKAVLKIGVAPFADSKRLYQALLRELRGVEIKSKTEVSGVLKDLFCSGFASDAVDKCMKPCLERCTVNDLKIDDDTFEPVERRQDFMPVYMEVAKENVSPFLSSLYAEYKQVMQMGGDILK